MDNNGRSVGSDTQFSDVDTLGTKALDAHETRRLLEPYASRPEALGIVCVNDTGVRNWSGALGVSVRSAMCALLERNIWPERFRRNYGVFSHTGMVRLLRSRVLILGCGGLGGHVATLLARMGVGSMRLCDSDIFEESNLNRQYFCTERTLGLGKAVITRSGILDIASYMDVEALAMEATPENLPELLGGMDAALDCLDHLPMKKALEEAALSAHIPFVHGAVLREEGFASLNATAIAQLSRLYPHDIAPAELAAARRQGVIATAPAGVACFMASMLAHLLAGERPADAAVLHHLDFSVPEMERFML